MPLVFDSQQRNPNILLNGDMAFAQWGATQSFGAGAGNAIATDRWLAYQTAAASASTLSQQSGGTVAGLPFFTRFQRNSGGTGTGVMNITQNVESAAATRHQGKTLTLSFYARAGSNFSSTSNLLTVQFFSGTGTDESIRTGYTGSSLILNTTVTLTTSFQLFVFSVAVPSNATEFAPLFNWSTTGTAGTNDYVDITGIMLNEGGFQSYRNAGQNPEVELAMLQRFYEKSFTENGISLAGVADAITYTSSTNPDKRAGTMKYKVTKRTLPTVQWWSQGTKTLGNVTDVPNGGGGSDLAATLGPTNVNFFALGISGGTGTGYWAFYWASSAEII